MDKRKIKQLCEQIMLASDNIVSVGTVATTINAPQLSGIQREQSTTFPHTSFINLAP